MCHVLFYPHIRECMHVQLQESKFKTKIKMET